MGPEMVQELEAQLKGGNVSLWEKGYYAFLRHSVLQEHQERFPLFDYNYSKRVVLYAWVNAKILGNGPIDFLEFGVFKGDSFQRWLGLHLDADLYSSTLFVLMTLNRHIQPGTVLVFDEFIAEDEFAAFHHFCKACMRQWRILAARRDLHKIALEITG